MKGTFVKVYFGKNKERQYEFYTMLRLEVGKTYSIRVIQNEFDKAGKTYDNYVTVASISEKRGKGYIGDIYTIVEAEMK